MVNILSILSNQNDRIKAIFLRISLDNNKRYVEKTINPKYICDIHEVVFYQEDNITKPIEYLGMSEEGLYDESRAYIINSSVDINHLNNNNENYYIITISEEYFDGLMS